MDQIVNVESRTMHLAMVCVVVIVRRVGELGVKQVVGVGVATALHFADET